MGALLGWWDQFRWRFGPYRWWHCVRYRFYQAMMVARVQAIVGLHGEDLGITVNQATVQVATLRLLRNKQVMAWVQKPRMAYYRNKRMAHAVAALLWLDAKIAAHD